MTDSLYKFSKLRAYFGKPYTITENLTVYQPTIGDIINYDMEDDDAFFQELNKFIGTPTQVRLQLWEHGVDWNKLTDYDLFMQWYTPDKGWASPLTELIFKGVDFSKFKPMKYSEEKGGGICFYNLESDVLIDEEVFNRLANYLRNMFQIFPKSEKAKGKITKQLMIDDDRIRIENAAKLHKNETTSSLLLPLISACVNHPGFKYNVKELESVGIVQFMDSVKRLQVYESTIALNFGRYSGMCDMSKVDSKLFDFMRDIDEPH